MRSFSQSAPAKPGKLATHENVRSSESAALSPLEVQRFTADGYIGVPTFCTPGELLYIRGLLLTLLAQKIGHREGQQFDMLGLDADANVMRQPQILNPSVFAPALLNTEHFRRVRTIARQLLGPYAQFSFDHCILKPAGSSAATPWHQDEAHHANKYFRYPQISFWMPLQDTPRESGCMRYIPGSHVGAVLPHRSFKDDPRIHAIECRPEHIDESAAIEYPVEAGTCILHDGRTLHGALPNTTAVDRLAYIVAFVGSPKRREAREFMQSIASDGAAAGEATSPQVVPAHESRRQRWLWRGGFISIALRRLRQGLRSHPKILLLKLKILATKK